MRTQNSVGFTLIEISIVLVIIGLLVGGILVGREMLKAAAIRGTITQITKYNSAVNTFRLKYNALPGDMPGAVAVKYGLYALSNPSGLEGMGDNNGIVEDGAGVGGGANGNTFAGEIPVFWRHLTDANLSDGQYGITGNSVPLIDTGIPTAAVVNLSQSMPTPKVGHGAMITIISGRGTNYFDIIPILGVSATGAYSFSLIAASVGLTPIEANAIDTKLDDGLPETGIALAQDMFTPPAAPVAGSPASLIGGQTPRFAPTSQLMECVIGDGHSATDTYNLVPSTGGTNMSCGLAIRFQ